MAKVAPFRPEHFTPHKFMSAEEKARFANRLVDFIAGGMEPKRFTKVLYNDLMQRFSFIAHYNVYGFAGEYFETPADKARFLRHIVTFAHDPAIHHGVSAADVEAAVADWVVRSGALARAEAAV